MPIFIYTPIPAFSLLAPSDSAFVPHQVTFNWTNPNPWEQLRYDLYVSTSKIFNPDSTTIYDSHLIQTIQRYPGAWKILLESQSLQ